MGKLKQTYDIEDIEELFKEVLNTVTDRKAVLQEVGEALLLNLDQRFEAEVDPSGKKWQKLSPFTLRLKEEQKRILKILQSTGRLRRSFEYTINQDDLVIGTNVSYAKKHQLGIGVPKREILGVSEEDKEIIKEILEDYLGFSS